MRRDLNSVNATKLELVLPYLTDTIDRYNTDMQHQIEAIIQREYTTIHPSVYWKFKKESQNYFQNTNHTKDYIFKEIVFKNVFPLYGQIDIKGSSEHRNETVKIDLKNQLILLYWKFLTIKNQIPIWYFWNKENLNWNRLRTELDFPLKADTEQHIQRYIEEEIHPILKNTKDNAKNRKIRRILFSTVWMKKQECFIRKERNLIMRCLLSIKDWLLFWIKNKLKHNKFIRIITNVLKQMVSSIIYILELRFRQLNLLILCICTICVCGNCRLYAKWN